MEPVRQERPEGLFRLFDLLQNPPPPVPCWIGSYLLPRNCIAVFGGHSKVGKTFIVFSFIEALITGAPLFGYHGFPVEEACRVLLIDRELGRNGIYDRTIQTLGRFLHHPRLLQEYQEKVWCISRDTRVSLSSRDGIDTIRRSLDISGANVLILDPIGKLHYWDENSASEMNYLFESLDNLLREYKERGLSIILSHHFSKGPAPKSERGDPLSASNFRGSIRFHTDPDSVLTVVKTKMHWEEVNTDQEWSWWEIVIRASLRHGRELRDFQCTINEGKSMKVLFRGFREPS
jgi:RecA-family ATPase